MIGLVSSIRFGFAPLGIPNTGLGSSENKTQGGLPPGAIRFGFRPRGSPSVGGGVPFFQSGLPPNALRFGFQPRGASVVPPVSGVEFTLSGGGHSELFVTTGTLGGGGLSYAINPMSKRTN